MPLPLLAPAFFFVIAFRSPRRCSAPTVVVSCTCGMRAHARARTPVWRAVQWCDYGAPHGPGSPRAPTGEDTRPTICNMRCACNRQTDIVQAESIAGKSATTMDLSELTATSPIDGRYGSKTASLRPYFSEFALFKYRVFVEIEWLKWLSAEKRLPEISGLSPASIAALDAINKVSQRASVCSWPLG